MVGHQCTDLKEHNVLILNDAVFILYFIVNLFWAGKIKMNMQNVKLKISHVAMKAEI